MMTKLELIQITQYEIERLESELSYTDLPPASTITNQLYCIHVASGMDPKTAFIQTVSDRKQDLLYDLQLLEN